jgi:HSP20 family protein
MSDFDAPDFVTPDSYAPESVAPASIAPDVFAPKFDVREVGDTYHLHGELPGVERSSFDLQVIDDQTLQIVGRSIRSYSSAPKASFKSSSSTITEIFDDESLQGGIARHRLSSANGINVNKNCATNGSSNVVDEVYWVKERIVGDFCRSFTFPVPVDWERIHASTTDGILTIILPKLKARKITVH